MSEAPSPDNSSRQPEPPRFDELGPAPDTPMGQVAMTGTALRRFGVERSQRWFRVFLVVAIVGLVAYLVL